MFATLEQALEAVKNNADSYKEVVAPMNGDKALAIVAVAKNGRLLKHCDDVLRADLEVVYEACSNAPIAIMYADFYIKQEVMGKEGDLLEKLKILMNYQDVKKALDEPKATKKAPEAPKEEPPKEVQKDTEAATPAATVEQEAEAPAQDLFTESVVEPNQEEQLVQGQIGEDSQEPAEPEAQEKVEEKKATNSKSKAKPKGNGKPTQNQNQKGKKPVAKKGEQQEAETDPE